MSLILDTMSNLTAGAEQFVHDFFTSLTEQILAGDDDPAAIIDRFYAPEFVQTSDGMVLDRDKLIAHMRPIRKNLVACRYQVHEAMLSDDRLAARFTIQAELRKAGATTTEVFLFGRLDPDRRLRQVHQLTKTAT
jgi:hypothetical protein